MTLANPTLTLSAARSAFKRSARPLGWRLARQAFLTVGELSDGIRTGKAYGFSSGEMLDYVYADHVGGRGPIGRLVDRVYLGSPGWRGIRERRANLVRILSAIVLTRRAQGQATRILDIAAGPGRYLLDLAAALGPDGLEIDCRDADADALALGRALAAARGLSHNVAFAQHDALAPGRALAAERGLSHNVAFAQHDAHAPGRALAAERGVLDDVAFAQHDALDAEALAAIRPRPDVVVVSGLYEILLDEHAICASLQGVCRVLPSGGLLVLTGQPHHPQLELIANLLTHRDGSPWRMHLRSTQQLESWCAAAGFVDVHTTLDTQGIFSVSLMRKP